MNILESDEEDLHYRIRIEDMDDLWYLYQLIKPGTLVGAHTYRKMEAREDTLRPDSQPRVKVFLEINVSSAEFHPFTDDLRVGGTIVTGPDDMSGHHTFNLSPGKTIEVRMESLSPQEKELFERAMQSSGGSKAVAVSLDDDDAEIFRIRDYGVERIATIRSSGEGKMFGSSGGWRDYYLEISEALSHHISDDTPILFIGPGFFKESLSKIARSELDLDPAHIHIINSSSGGLRGLNEALSSGKGLARAVEDLRYQKETSMVNRLMEAIGKGSLVAYGKEEVEKALAIGAVDLVLITETVFRKGPGRDLISMAENMGSRGMIISTSHEAGEMLDKLGGYGAFLRYEIS